MTLRRGTRRSLSAALRDRELGGNSIPSLAPLLSRLQTTAEDEYGFWTVSANNVPSAVPPFSIQFSHTALHGHALLAADEEGVITVLDTRRSLAAQMRAATSATSPVARFRAHDNAIFDAVWLPGDTHVATASGDASARVFDVEMASRSALLRGHAGSVKCVRALPDAQNVLLTAARDGHVRAFDIRTPSVYDPTVCREMFHKPVYTLEQPHAPAMPPRPAARKRRRVVADPPRGSVTALAMMPGQGHLLFTSGAADGSVKLWDVRGTERRRMGSKVVGGLGASCVGQATPGMEVGGRGHGIASLDVDGRGRYLAVGATDSTIYLYEAGELKLGWTKKLMGHTQTSFYIRSRFSPCGRFVLSGSADSKAYLWDVEGGGEGGVVPASLMLEGHGGGEVAGVDWCGGDGVKVATCGDDGMAKVWKIGGGEAVGRAKKVEWRGGGGVRDGRIGGKVRKVGVVRRSWRDGDIRRFFEGVTVK